MTCPTNEELEKITHDFALNRGTTKTIVATIPETMATSVAGYTASLVAKRYSLSETVSFELSESNGIEVGSTDRSFTITFTDSLTSSLDGVYSYLFKVTSPDNKTTWVLVGKITINWG